jgi:hypothetical protein
MNDVGSGVVQGGWEFVTAAFLVTAVMLTGYTASVIARYRGLAARRTTPDPKGGRS